MTSFNGFSTMGQMSYNAQGSLFPSISQATVSLITVNCHGKKRILQRSKNSALLHQLRGIHQANRAIMEVNNTVKFGPANTWRTLGIISIANFFLRQAGRSG